MNPKYDIYEEIDRYLNEELSEAELAVFNQKLANDAEFKSLVDAQKLANEIIIDQEMIKLKERMRKEMNADNTSSGPWGKLLIICAVVATSAAWYTYSQYFQSKTDAVKDHSIGTLIEQQAKSENEQSNHTIKTTAPVKTNNKEGKNLDAPGPHLPYETTPVTEPEKEVASTQEITHTPVLTPHKEEVKQAAAAAEELAKVNCATVHITARVHVDYGFENNGDATIVIDESSVKGGKAPYAYSIDQTDFDNDHRFSGIKDGTYQIRIKDGNNCVSQLKKEVVVKTPVKEIDEAFAPSHGERWKLPLRPNADALVTIFNKTGAIVYSANISAGYPEEWDGKSNTGVELESGNYYFAIQYSARDVVKGHISIVK